MASNDVTQTFVADTQPWISNMQAATKASQAFRDAVNQDTQAIQTLRGAMASLPVIQLQANPSQVNAAKQAVATLGGEIQSLGTSVNTIATPWFQLNDKLKTALALATSTVGAGGKQMSQEMASAANGAGADLEALENKAEYAGKHAAASAEEASAHVSSWGSKLGAVAGFLGGPWGAAIGVGVVAVGSMIEALTHADASTQTFIDTMNQGLANVPASQGLGQLGQSVSALGQRIASVQPNLDALDNHLDHTSHEAGRALEAFGNSFKGNGNIITASGGLIAKSFDFVGAAWDDMTGHMNKGSNLQALNHQMSTLYKEQTNLVSETGTLAKQGDSVSEAMGLMDQAGVTVTDSLSTMNKKVADLVGGFKQMGVAGPVLGNSLNAVTFASQLQQAKIQQLTQGWTTFISMVTSGSSGFVSFAQQMRSIGTAASGVANSATGAKASMKGLDDASLQLRSAFTQGITSASNLENSLYTMSAAAGEGAKGTAMLERAGKDMVQQLMPMAKGSDEARAQLYALAQQAGYTGADKLSDLAKWAGKVKNPMQDLDNITSKLTLASADLAKDVSKLSNAIDTQLNGAMASAAFNAAGGQKSFDEFAKAATTSHGNLGLLHGSASDLAKELIAMTGSTTQAHNEFDVFAEKMGLSKGQADKLWKSVTSLGNALNGIHDASATVTINEIVRQSGGTVTQMATGGLVPGYGRGDIVPALLEPGEAIVPRHLVGAVAPVLAANNVPGFAAGGIVGGSVIGGRAGQPVHVHVEINGRELATAIIPDLVGAAGRYSYRNSGKATGLLRPS